MVKRPLGYHTRKKDRVDLNDISVQMKLMVIHDNAKEDGMRLADTLVPKSVGSLTLK